MMRVVLIEVWALLVHSQVLLWALLIAAGALLKPPQVISILSYLAGILSPILGFVLPALCYFRLAPISNDFSAIPIYGIVPNRIIMGLVLAAGIVCILLRCYMAVSCAMSQGPDHGNMCFRGLIDDHHTVTCDA